MSPPHGSAPSARRSTLGRILREPFVHFTLLGGLAFALEGAVATDDEERPIVVTAQTRRTETDRLTEELGRPPTRDEIKNALHEWARQEALVREGLRQGLDQDDPIIRRQIVQNLRELQGRSVVDPKPTEAEVESWIAQHGSKYDQPLRYDLELVWVSPGEGSPPSEETERKVLESLREGATLPEPWKIEKILARPPEYLGENYGQSFSAAVPRLPLGKWTLAETKKGKAAVRLVRVRGGEISKEHKRRRATTELTKQKISASQEEREAEIFSRYDVVWETDL